MQKTCALCNDSFVLDEHDLSFYQRMEVDTPQLCPVCRFRRRALWRNERTLYSRTCGLCKKNIISMYHPDAPYTVYCQACYFSDQWDSKSYGMSYDPQRPFLDQFSELLRKVPKRNLFHSGVSTNCEYQNFAGHNKDCYMTFNTGYSEGIMYSRGLRESHDSLDCYYGVNAERSYESINIHDSSSVRWGHNVRNCLDSWFLRDCSSCTNCFGCVNLRHKEYHVFNEPASKDAYETLVRGVVGSYARLKEMKEKFDALSVSLPHKQNHNLKSEDCSGDYIVDSNSCQNCFEVDKSENARNCYFVKTVKDCYDMIGYGYESELLLETVATGRSQKMIGTDNCEYSHDCEYSFELRNCESCIGCDSLHHARTMILNTQYSDSDYAALRKTILESLQSEGNWGEFLHPRFAPFAYNETVAQDYYPMTKDEALARGYRWQDDMPGTRGKETIEMGALPDHIEDVPESILQEILACIECGKNYKILPRELKFYREMHLPLPRYCFNCRHVDRLKRRGSIQLFTRDCAHCSRQIQTTFAPDKPEVVYCESCYQAEIV
ncbi:MAG: hypothetical protein Q8P56_02220 [Candidatus Uhrbacteria bacterium]|nr:hypothetical protein [Candidatus Uhrbacteria bacterium]